MSRAQDIHRINQQIKHFDADLEREEYLSRWIYECPPEEKAAVTDALVAVRRKRREAGGEVWEHRERRERALLKRGLPRWQGRLRRRQQLLDRARHGWR